jgi:hypothetical protein
MIVTHKGERDVGLLMAKLSRWHWRLSAAQFNAADRRQSLDIRTDRLSIRRVGLVAGVGYNGQHRLNGSPQTGSIKAE